MGLALYRKYRPKYISQVIGQEHITDTLQHALKTGQLSHAYLFTGPRGVGKTSIARILAHEINDIPYTDDSMHMDIIEIDAASNRRIDEIRELRDKVNIAPTSARYKVYIIDEAHMLTREAFNALLKTLEEPPAHVIFILATTESHKLPDTIVSRTQRYTFKPVAHDKVVTHLRMIADAEGLKIDDAALELVATHGEGSFRDSISLLDQTRGYDATKAVGSDYIRALMGLPTDEAIEAVWDALQQHDAAALSRTLTETRDQGFAASQISKRLGQRIRADILQNVIAVGIFDLLQKLLDVPAAHDPETYLELILLEYALAGHSTVVPQPTIKKDEAPKLPVTVPVAATPPITITTPVQPPKPTESADTISKDMALEQQPNAMAVPKQPADSSMPISKSLDSSNWPDVLDCLKKTHNTLYGIARMSRPVFHEDGVMLYFKFAFHQKRLSEAKNRDVILAAIRQQTGRYVAIKCLVEDKGLSVGSANTVTPSTSGAHTSSDTTDRQVDPLADISNIFGDAEVLKS